ncbi:MAG: DUF362 domain-containing protein, partial [Thermodesulfobacteriota bacterium]
FQKGGFLEFKLDIIKCTTFDEIKDKVSKQLERYSDIFPKQKNAKVLLKPNLNSNMNALTGNTTDLRILSAVIVYLKDRGYTNITIGEGTNSGFYRNNISVISRLEVDRLAKYFDVSIIDLNESTPHKICFDKGIKASISKEVIEAELLINLPKLKTHFENGMTVCLKNLMGCLIGQENKKKAHDNLPENILRINDVVKPHIHIVDAVIGMEGLGPTKGVPVRLDRIIIGTDPYLIDLACASMAMFDYRKVRTLELAQKKGILTKEYFDFIESIDFSSCRKKFAPPVAGLLATFIHNPKRQKFFLKIRNTAFFSYLASTDWFGKLLYLTDLRQDVFLSKEKVFNRLVIDESLCDDCGICRSVCPLGISLPDDIEKIETCIQCLYCYSVCPRKAIKFEGNLGFFSEQIEQYDKIIRNIYK